MAKKATICTDCGHASRHDYNPDPNHPAFGWIRGCRECYDAGGRIEWKHRFSFQEPNYAYGYGMLSGAIKIAIDMLERQEPQQTVEAALRTALEQTEKTVRATENQDD